MRMLGIVLLATTAMTGAAMATEAFVGQVGNGNAGLNIQLGQGTQSTSKAVIFQRNNPNQSTVNGHDALQVQIGNNNDAYTFQDSYYFDHVALSWQEGTGNSSVNVQMTNESNGDVNDSPIDARFKARTIQLGNNNVGVNWQSDSATGFTGLMTLTPNAPTLGLQGDTIPVNAVNTTAAAWKFGQKPMSYQ